MKKGYSLIELLMFLFIVAIIVVALFPLTVVEKDQAQRIAIWKDFYPELIYAQDLFKNKESQVIKAYETTPYLEPDVYFQEFTKFMPVKDGKIINNKNYRYRYLNGRRVKKSSKYYSHQFVELENGIIIGFAGLERDADNVKNSPIGLLFVDIDGKNKRRNFLGSDIFVVNVYAERIEPLGGNLSRQDMKEDCSPVGTGLNCAAYYLYGGVF